MPREYFSSRKGNKEISVKELHSRLVSLFTLFHERDYLKEKLKIPHSESSTCANRLAHALLGFEPFPLTLWLTSEITEDRIFDTIELLFEHVSKPGPLVAMRDETNYGYYDFESYDTSAGQQELREMANTFLRNFGVGYEIGGDGKILALGDGSLRQILTAEITEYDERNVDSKVRNAIRKWLNRELSMELRREAIRELADVFEWLKKTKDIQKVLDSKDSSALFEIANNFALRHHNPKQKSNYDESIWYPWMFHFYLATYHAVIRLLKKSERT